MNVTMRHINKSFGPIQVLHDVELNIKSGEVLALVGENGAGKSTMMKILTGIYTKDSGEILIDDQRVDFHSIRDSEAKGIFIVNQELNVFKDMTVLDNLFLNKEVHQLGIIDEHDQATKAKEIFSKLGIDLDLYSAVGTFSVGQQQMLEIAKSLLLEAKLIIMDEPTSALSSKEIDMLFRVIRRLQETGTAIIYISHRMKEIFELCDRIVILRDGRLILSSSIADMTFESVVKNMVGYELGGLFPPKPVVPIGAEVLRVEELSHDNRFTDISFHVHAGEIVGFAGLMGSGRTDVMNVLFGIEPKTKGRVYVNQEEVHISSPQKAKAAGMAYVTENRKDEGLFLDFSIAQNILITNLRRLSRRGVVKEQETTSFATSFMQQVNAKYQGIQQLIDELSGGNQQKVVLAKWLGTSPNLLVLDEPTRGIDVNSKKQIYELIFSLAEKGMAIIVVSSELIELLGICDRIIVMREGHKMTELVNHELNDEVVMSHMMGASA
jgi:ribose transport system ATP-binding protein